MPEQQCLVELGRLDVATRAELVELTLEPLHRRLQIGECLAGVGSRLEPVAQRIELLGHCSRIGLQHARGLQGCDIGAHLGREPEACDQNCTHHECQHRTDTDRDELAIALFACQIHC
jgi:hypothetical protein